MGRVPRLPGRYYSVHDDTMQALADAVRGLDYKNETMTIGDMTDKLKNMKLGIKTSPIDDHIDANGKWVRPTEYPDLDSIEYEEDEEVVYLTYDLRKTPGYGWIGLYVQNVTNNTYFSVERGHLENGVFVADYSVRHQSTNSTVATSPRYFREKLDEENGLVQLWRVKSEEHIANIKFCCGTTTTAQNLNYRLQPCVERVGQLGYITSLASYADTNTTTHVTTATNTAWVTFWLEREKMRFTGKAACTSLTYAYYRAYSLQELDMSEWHTAGWRVTNLSYMFSACYALRRLDLSSWDTSEWAVTTMAYMFNACCSLEHIDFTGWDTSNWKPTTLTYMFSNCTALVGLDLSSWDVSGWTTLTSLAYWFYCCYGLQYLKTEWGEDTADWGITTLQNTFRGCYTLRDTDFWDWNTSGWKVTNLTGTFASFWGYKKIDLTHWDTSGWNVTTMTEMFRYNRCIDEVDMSTWDVNGWTNLTVLRYMFEDCGSLRIIKVPNLPYKGTSANLGNSGIPTHYFCQYFSGISTTLAHSYAGCHMLSIESLVSILERLPEVSTATTITFNQYQKLKLTDEQIAIATAKGWTVA